MLSPNQKCQMVVHLLKGNKLFPNNNRFPLLIYKSVFYDQNAETIAQSFESTLRKNGWTPLWRDIIYPYAHYHSTSHEGLGIFKGSCVVQFGGEEGVTETVDAGDYVLIPAGVSHKSLQQTDDFQAVGSYPNDGSCVDMNYGKPNERPTADEHIAGVVVPDTDPLFGSDGPMFKYWPTSRH